MKLLNKLFVGLLIISILAVGTPLSAQAKGTSIVFQGHKYELIKKKMTWHSAKDACEQMGGHLVTITSAEEMAAISTIIPNSNTFNTVWIGATDAAVEGSFQWVTGEPFEYTNWKSIYEPNNYNNEDYVQIDENPGWNDASADQRCYFICEWDYDLEASYNQEIKEETRRSFCNWADLVSIANINIYIASLTKTERMSLCKVLLDSNALEADRNQLLELMNAILSKKDLGFYAHIFSYTSINLEGDGFYYWGGGQVTLARDDFLGMGMTDQRNTLMHECFHSFNDQNNGPSGALDEGSAIWVYKRSFGAGSSANDFAEATYGTKLYYKVYMNDPSYPLEAPRTYSNKLIEVYTWLSKGDPSRLPWWDNDLLVEMYDRYYASLNRDVDFDKVWLPSVKKAREAMLKDPLMIAADRLPMPTPQP